MFFFQQLPPFSGAVALRGKAFVSSLISELPFVGLSVFCANSDAEEIEGAKLVRLNAHSPDSSASTLFRLTEEIKIGLLAVIAMIRVGRPDALIVSTPSYVATLILIFYARIRRIEYSLDVRDVYPEVYVESGLIKRNGLVHRALQLYISGGAFFVALATVVGTILYSQIWRRDRLLFNDRRGVASVSSFMVLESFQVSLYTNLVLVGLFSWLLVAICLIRPRAVYTAGKN